MTRRKSTGDFAKHFAAESVALHTAAESEFKPRRTEVVTRAPRGWKPTAAQRRILFEARRQHLAEIRLSNATIHRFHEAQIPVGLLAAIIGYSF